MTCREIPSSTLSSARSLEDVYSQLGVRRGTDGAALPPPDIILPDGTPSGTFTYLGGTEGRDYNLVALYDNNQAGLNCVLNSLGYNEARGQAIEQELNALGSEDAIEQRLNELSVGDRRTYSIYSTLQVINYFRGAGNTDGNQNIISMQEIAAWAWERCGHNAETHQATATPAVRRMHALLGLSVFLTRDVPPATRSAVTLISGNPMDLAAPEGGWRTGDRVFVGNTAIDGVPASGSDAFRIQGSALPVGSHTVEIRRVDGSIVRTAVTVNNQEEHRSFISRAGDWLSRNWEWVAGGAGSVLALGAVYALGVRNGRSSGNPSGGNNPATGKNPAEGAGRQAAAPAAAAPGAVAPINVTVPVTVNANETNSGTRSEGRGSNPPPSGGATGNYSEVLTALGGGEGAPNADVLAALGEGDPLPAAAINSPFAEILTNPVNDAVIEAQLRAADPILADYYRANISSAAQPVTTMGELINRISINHPGALAAAQTAMVSEGRAATEMTERIVFELVARAADWSPADLVSRPDVVSRFESSVREARGVNRVENTEARAERERLERERESRRSAEHVR